MTSKIPAFATVDPFDGMTADNPGETGNLIAGEWRLDTNVRDDIVDPMNGDHFLRVPDTQDIGPFITGLQSCPKSGLHNPLKNPERYVLLGEVCARAAARLAENDAANFLAKLMQRVVPKSWQQCVGEVTVTRVFLASLNSSAGPTVGSTNRNSAG